jgi:hypothetical protein
MVLIKTLIGPWGKDQQFVNCDKVNKQQKIYGGKGIQNACWHRNIEKEHNLINLHMRNPETIMPNGGKMEEANNKSDEDENISSC